MISWLWDEKQFRLQAVLERLSKMDNVALQQIFNRVYLLKHEYLGEVLSNYVPTVSNETIAIKK